MPGCAGVCGGQRAACAPAPQRPRAPPRTPVPCHPCSASRPLHRAQGGLEPGAHLLQRHHRPPGGARARCRLAGGAGPRQAGSRGAARAPHWHWHCCRPRPVFEGLFEGFISASPPAGGPYAGRQPPLPAPPAARHAHRDPRRAPPPARPPACLPACLPACPPACLPPCLPACLPARPPACLGQPQHPCCACCASMAAVQVQVDSAAAANPSFPIILAAGPLDASE